MKPQRSRAHNQFTSVFASRQLVVVCPKDFEIRIDSMFASFSGVTPDGTDNIVVTLTVQGIRLCSTRSEALHAADGTISAFRGACPTVQQMNQIDPATGNTEWPASQEVVLSLVNCWVDHDITVTIETLAGATIAGGELVYHERSQG